jgi:hypothetical protein
LEKDNSEHNKKERGSFCVSFIYRNTGSSAEEAPVVGRQNREGTPQETYQQWLITPEKDSNKYYTLKKGASSSNSHMG